jgi:5-methylcytosine-specific restriction endonuclease McrBC GTP-binding regulatory subunit McrB
MAIRSYPIRRLLGKIDPYEGVWLESYSVNDIVEGELKPVPQRSVFIIDVDLADNHLKIYGNTFSKGKINEAAYYRGEVLFVDKDKKQIEYKYEGGYPDDNTRLHGYGYVKFYEDLNTRRLERGIGRWVEIADEKESWLPMGETKVVRIPNRQVRSLLNKKSYPSSIDEFHALSNLEIA